MVSAFAVLGIQNPSLFGFSVSNRINLPAICSWYMQEAAVGGSRLAMAW